MFYWLLKTVLLGPVLRVIFRPWVEGIEHVPETGGAILAFVVIFLVAFIGFRLVARALGERTRKSVVGPIDRALGLGFGAIKGLIGASLLFLLINLFFDVTWGRDEAKPEWLQASRTYPLLKLSSQAIVDWVEQRRSPSSDTPAASGRAETDGSGYDRSERQDLEELLKDSGGTEI